MLYVRAEEETSSFSERRCGWLKAILRLKPRCSLFAARMYPRYKNEICRHGTGAQLSRAMSIDMPPGAQLSRAMSIDMVPGAQLSRAMSIDMVPGAQLSRAMSIDMVPGAQLSRAMSIDMVPGAQLSRAMSIDMVPGSSRVFFLQRIGVAADAATRAECHVNGHGTTTRTHPLTCRSRHSRVPAAKKRRRGWRRDKN